MNDRNKPGVRVRSIRIPVKVLELSVSHYGDRLGLKWIESDVKNRVAKFHADLPLGPEVELVEATKFPPLHFPVSGGHFQPFFRLHASDLEGMYARLEQLNTRLTAIHQNYPDDGCGIFFECADPDGSWVQLQVNFDESPTTRAKIESVMNIEMPVSDVKRSARFYQQIGFRLDRTPDDNVGFLSAGYLVDRFGYESISEFGLILSRRADFPTMEFERGDSQEAMLLLETENLEEYHHHLLEQGIQTTLNESGQLSLSDPDGHRWLVENMLQSPAVSDLAKTMDTAFRA